jgi:hypothetical protein
VFGWIMQKWSNDENPNKDIGSLKPKMKKATPV